MVSTKEHAESRVRMKVLIGTVRQGRKGLEVTDRARVSETCCKEITVWYCRRLEHMKKSEGKSRRLQWQLRAHGPDGKLLRPGT